MSISKWVAIIFLFSILFVTKSYGESDEQDRPPATSKEESEASGSWTSSSFWKTFASGVQGGWDKFANDTTNTFEKFGNDTKHTFEKVVYPQLEDGWLQVTNHTARTFGTASTGIQDGWNTVANATVDTFQKVQPQIQDAWDVVKNQSISSLETVSIGIQETWDVVANSTTNTFREAISRIQFVFDNLYCPSPANNQTLNESIRSNKTDILPAYDDGEDIQQFACTALKTLKVIGIAIGGGLAVALLWPVAFLVVMWLIGFTFIGKVDLFPSNIANLIKIYFAGVAAGSCAAICQARIGSVAANSCFSMLQSITSVGAPMFGACFVLKYPILISWLLSSILIGYLIWPYF